MSRIASLGFRICTIACAIACIGAGAAGLAACSIPNTAFRATPDGGTTIAVSAASFDVTEGSTATFTVQLTQPPMAAVTVRIAAADAESSAHIGISLPELHFDATDFDQPQTITVTGLVDPDTVDNVAMIALSADGLDTVTVTANVRDPDKVDIIVTGIATSGILNINEGASATVQVHLGHQPPGDVRVMIVLGSGPVTASASQLTFTAANYTTVQAVTFTAPDDVNIVSEDESLTFQATGSQDQLYTIHDIDKDTLNISATPTTLSVNEGGSSQVSVTLTQQPKTDTTVHVAIQLGNVSIDHTDLTFTPQNFGTAQVITVSAPQDQNTTNEQDQLTLSIPGSTVTPVTIAVTTIDDDVQAILEDAPNPLMVVENETAPFGVTLKFQPAGTVTVAVSSLDNTVATASPGTLTFTPQNYNDATVHQVTVRGAPNNNLVTNNTSIQLHEPTLVDKLVPVAVANGDIQQIVVNPGSVTVNEGATGSFNVSLMFDPGSTVTVNLADTNAAALPISPTSLTFTGGPSGSWRTPMTVTVSPPIDNNAVSETATVTVSGGGAPNPATVALTAHDTTVVQNWGFPTSFTGSFQIPANFVYAYQINVGAVANLATFHNFLIGGGGTYTMALYTDAGGVPGSIVPNAAMPGSKIASTGTNDSDALALPPQLSSPVYWLAIKFSQTNTIGYGAPPAMGQPGTTGMQCLRNVMLSGDTWPSNFGTAMCQQDFAFNIWITTFHQ